MVDHAAKGLEGTPFPVRIEQGKVQEFARAVRSQNPAHLAAEAPVVPPTFLITQMFWEEWAGPDANPWPKVAMDPSRGLHAEQEFVFHGPPPRAGDVLTAQSRIEDVSTKDSRRGLLTFVTQVTEFRDAEGRLVAENRLTGVELPPQEEQA